MLTMCHHLLKTDAETRAARQGRYRFILVDEFQDVNRAQFECLRMLAEEHRNLFVVGDDDQSIYAFRGARPDFLLQFPMLYPDAQRVTLNTNYRSTDRVIALAERVIGNNEVRFAKEMHGTGIDGDKVTFFLADDVTAEADRIAEKIADLMDEGVALSEMAVIYRTNLQGGVFARALYKKGIPYELRESGANVYDHWIAKDLLAYLFLAENEESDSALRRILNKPKRYIGRDLLVEAEKMPYTLMRSFFACPSLKKWQEEHLENLRADLNQIRRKTVYDGLKYIRKVIGYDEYLEEFAVYRRTSAQVLWEIADEVMETARDCKDVKQFRERLEEMSRQMQGQNSPRERKRSGVQLMTMHGAKGLEFRAVFLPSLIEGVVPHEKGLEQVEEERRLFYVAMTRAEEKLCLSAVRKRYEKETKPSRFLAEMGLETEKLFGKK
ncbi:MAG: ATP-dependent helicase, partial [Anaerotignum sp.]|nr:ATP-dependent helicase [Anaerotignum sp.]